MLKEEEITAIDEIEKILSEAEMCRIALIDKDRPYIVPMCFGYCLEGGRLELYFCCDEKSELCETLKTSAAAAFETDKIYGVVSSEKGCLFDAEFECITGTGSIGFITGIDKITALGAIMKKYKKTAEERNMSEQELNSMCVLMLTADEFCCKKHINEN